MANPKLLSKVKLQYVLNKMVLPAGSLSTIDGFVCHPVTGHLVKITESNGIYSVKHLQVNVPSQNWLWDSFNFYTDVLS